MRLRRYSIELYNELGVFETVGSLRIAAAPESLKELQRRPAGPAASASTRSCSAPTRRGG